MKKINLFLVMLLVFGLFGINVRAAEDDDKVTRLDAVYMLIYGIGEHPDLRSYRDFTGDRELCGVNEIASVYEQEAWMTAIVNGIITGYEDGTYRPGAYLTRAEYAVMIQNASRFLTHDKITEIEELPYEDLSDWNADAIKYCIERGYMLGYGNAFGVDDNLLESQCDLVTERLRNGWTAYEKYMTLTLAGKSPLKMEKIMNDLEGIPLAEYDIIDDYYSFGRQPLNDFSIYKFSNRYIWDAWNFDYRTADDEFIRNQAEKISHYKLLSPQKTETEIEKWTAYLIKLKENQVIRECFMVTNPSLCLSNHTLDGHTLRIVSGYIYVIYDNGTDDLLPRNQEGQLENNKWYRQKAKITVIRGVTNDSLEIWFGGLAPAELVPEEFLN